ncbi:MAG: gliding motility-associated C-terminal domain-containing protein, partial [Bacteroidota bacterium]
TCDNGKVYCLNGTTGAMIWSYTIINTTENFWASPVVGDINNNGQLDVVVVSPAAFNNSGGEVIAFNGNNGTVIWKYTNAAFGWDIIPQSPVIADLNQDCQPDVLAPQKGNLYNINGSTGLLQWSKNGAGNASPAIADMDGDCDLEIILGGPRIYDSNGNQIYNGGGGGSGWNAPAPRVGDFNPTSPGLEIVLGTAYDQTGNVDIISMWSSTCVKLWGYRKAGHTNEGMCVADIDNDGCVEVVFNPDCCNGTSSVIALDDVSGAANCGFSTFPSSAGLTTNTNPCVNDCVTFTNLTSPCATGWEWDFPGGTPSTYTGSTPPNICYNTLGTYTARIIATFGTCSPIKKDTAYLNIVVKNCSNPTVSTTSSSVCPGACNDITATGSGGTSPYTYSWNPGSGTGSSFNVCPSSTTTYTVIATDNAGGTASNTAVVTVNPAPTVSVGNVSICTGGSTPLTATGATTYTWSPGTGLSSTTGTTVTANPTSTTTYTVVGTTNGCTGSTTVVVSVGALIPNAGSNVTICPGSTTTLNASGGTDYNWTPATGLSNATIFNPVANPASTTTYTVTVTSGTCTGTASVIVTVENSPTVTVPPASICSGNSTTLTASGANTYIWTPNTSLSSGTGATVTANPTSTTTYTVTGTSSAGCTGSTTVVVTITSGTTLIGTGGITCAGVPVLITASGADTYTWTPTTSLSSSTGSTVSAGPSNTTTYTVTGTSTATGCTGSTTVVVTILPSPVANFTMSPASPVAPNKVVTFTDVSTNPGDPEWNFGDPLSMDNTSTLTSPTHTYSTEGDYCITLASTNATSGCSDTTTKCIIVIGEAVIIFPNVFTPNGDKINDIFYFHTKGVSALKCTIYDRWGLKMYEWNTVTGGWDGSAKNGSPAPDGVYYFIMEATPANGAPVIPKQGFLQLLEQPN